jgi:hypothetical protein
MKADNASPSPLPGGERAFRRDLARGAFARRIRKSHGGKGEGAKASKIYSLRFPLTRGEAASELRCDLSPPGRGVDQSHGR